VPDQLYNMQLKPLLRKLSRSDRHKRHSFCLRKTSTTSVVGLTSCYAQKCLPRVSSDEALRGECEPGMVLMSLSMDHSLG